MRADRLGNFGEGLQLMSETNLDVIEEPIKRTKPEMVVIDSIQTMFNEEVSSAPGSVSQVRESTAVFMRLAKEQGVTIFIVGHVTKEGTVAGPRMLEHMVDTVLYFEGDRHASYRILRGVKNRFGSTNEIAVFDMQSIGLVEIDNEKAKAIIEKELAKVGLATRASLDANSRALVAQQNLNSNSTQSTLDEMEYFQKLKLNYMQ